MYNREFMSKESKDAYDFLEQLVGSSQLAWDSYEPKENLARGKQGTSAIGGEKYTLSEGHDINARLAIRARKEEAMEEKKIEV